MNLPPLPPPDVPNVHGGPGSHSPEQMRAMQRDTARVLEGLECYERCTGLRSVVAPILRDRLARPVVPLADELAFSRAVINEFCRINGIGGEARPAAPPDLPEDIAAVVACLGDDAALLRTTTTDCEEVADNMDDAAELIERLAAIRPAVPLTDEQIEACSRAAHTACDSNRMARWSTEFARAVINEFCRINGIKAPESE